MFNAQSIRPVALGLLIKDGKLLVMRGYDKKKDNYFYRCLGGGIEYGEKSDEELRREFKEEIDLDIDIKKFLGIEENIFTYNGNLGHEIVFYYDIDIKDEDLRDEYKMVEDGKDDIAIWMDIEDFKSKKEILYPDNIFRFL